MDAVIYLLCYCAGILTTLIGVAYHIKKELVSEAEKDLIDKDILWNRSTGTDSHINLSGGKLVGKFTVVPKGTQE